ncbi:hypothetical protein ACIQXI_06885 [Lysinibacillus sp. NPDC097195]|uniref:hypothetical protein n=1 Tax=Lysinibacillus sp. NPDC097195 TaxID=3364141 RepID=UPI00380C60E9
MQFNIGDLISTLFILVIFIAMFYLLIKMIKKVKTTPLPPPSSTLQHQVAQLVIRVNDLEKQVHELSKRP